MGYSKIENMSVQLVVTDLSTSINFYVTELGFSKEFQYEDFYAGIIKDGFSIHLKVGKGSIEERKSKRNNEDLDIIFTVHDIEKLYQEFLQKSIEIIQPIRDMPYGKEFYIIDPDGYILSYLNVR